MNQSQTFIKRFNKMFGKIPAEIKPSDASAKITFSAAFDAEFCLILRERTINNACFDARCRS